MGSGLIVEYLCYLHSTYLFIFLEWLGFRHDPWRPSMFELVLYCILKFLPRTPSLFYVVSTSDWIETDFETQNPFSALERLGTQGVAFSLLLLRCKEYPDKIPDLFSYLHFWNS